MKKAAKKNLFDIQSCPYVRFDFPPAKDLGGGEDDPICRVCFVPCSENSTCANRYIQVQGQYIGRHPEGPQPEDSGPDIFQLCDKCYESTNVNSYQANCPNGDKYFVVMGTNFDVDSDYRMND